MAKKTKLEKDFEWIIQILAQIGAEGVADGAYVSLREAMKNPDYDVDLAILCNVVKRTSISLEIIYNTIVVAKSQESEVFKHFIDMNNASRSTNVGAYK